MIAPQVEVRPMKSKDEQTHHTRSRSPSLEEAGVVDYLSTQTDVVAAYLFGSLAVERATSRSDVDIAILLVDASDPLAAGDCQLQLMGELERFTDREVDVIILNTAPPILQHQVLRHGRLLYERDLQARVEFEVRAGQIYADLKPMYDSCTRDLLQKIREVGLGGRRRRRRQQAHAAR
jgi:predicted nucleotidyltransferase